MIFQIFFTEGSINSYLPDKDLNKLRSCNTYTDSLINKDELELEIF